MTSTPVSPAGSRSWPDSVLWSVAETSAYLRVPAKTLYEWRYKGDGPPSHRVGRYVRYVPAEVRAWVTSR